VLDPALMRPGRLDRKIEIPLPNEQARIQAHAESPLTAFNNCSTWFVAGLDSKD